MISKMIPYHIIGTSQISNDLLTLARNDVPWINYFNFETKFVPDELIEKDRFLNELRKKYEFIVGIIKLPPRVCYVWHTDTKRGVAVNMLLNPEIKSTCLFAKEFLNDAQISIQELKYERDNYYLFNTQVPHTVINYNEPRYMMSVEFAKDLTQLTYEDVFNDFN